MSKRMISAIIAGVLGLIIVIAILAGGIGKNEAHNWQIIQSVNGKITVRDKAGWYPKWFATVWTYPRYVDKTWSDVEYEGDRAKESVRVTFNDGGTAQISSYIRYSTPTDEQERIEFHRQFSGNIENATIAVKSHLTNCLKATGPLMSATENQAARKAEFTQLLWNQMTDGLYEMRRVEKTVEVIDDIVLDPTSTKVAASPTKSKEIRIGTELILDDEGKPIISNPSPLTSYGIKLLQFSVKDIDYDEETRLQFAAKKQSYLAAEQSKADREKEKQERLNVIEKGLREVAEAQAAANVVKEKAVVEAQQKAEVAMQEKLEAETKAEMALAVAEIAKQEAQVKLDTAELDAQAIEVLAQAERKKIELAGALTELEQAMIDAQVQMAGEVADGLSKIPVPAIVMGGGGQNGGDLTSQLINLKLMVDSGILDKMGIDSKAIQRQIDRSNAGAANE